MDHFINIYTNLASAYHQMIACEDVDGNLLPALESVVNLKGKCVLDLGSGSGRIPLLLRGRAGYLVGLDIHLAMLRESQNQRQIVDARWDLLQADMRHIALPSKWADIITAGWAIGHLRSWFKDDWQLQIGQVIEEMLRVIKPGGKVIILETLGTGSLAPAPPAPGLGEYYAWLEDEWGFTRQVISTDYLFDSVEMAVHRTEFFFGSGLAETIREHGWARLPEWTGMWVKRIP
jgi:ubiquinone/menaquinone biosynthesis C-methylase UbiE